MEKMVDKEKFCVVFPSFNSLPKAVLDDILSGMELHSYPADAAIYSSGDRCSGIAFLLSGGIRVFKTGETGREITLYEIGAGETCILNASCIISGMPYPANAYSVSAGEMLLMPAQMFSKLISEFEQMRDFVFGLLSRRLTAMMELVEEVSFRSMDERLAAYLVEKSESGNVFATHQKIANDLGTSREVVTRLLRDLERSSKISCSRGNIRLLAF
ncbi:MAG: Crp/Fnr family transcriptional regulator [Nitrospirae bacterium]|nr:Crp/Fnr family transcriptional regulator [Nitrospirota bacterium]